MAILAECPTCRKKQSTRNKECSCGQNLDKAKRSKRVKYWINYRLPSGKQRREVVGCSIEDARAAEGKRKAQKKENPKVLEILSGNKMTFSQLADWYLDLQSVKGLKSYYRNLNCLKNFNNTFGDIRINDICLTDLEDYQIKRLSEGMAKASVDLEISTAYSMVNKAFDSDKISGDILKPFRRIKKLLKQGSNARKRTVAIKEYLQLLDVAPDHAKSIIILAFNTGMRAGEIMKLKWEHVKRKDGFIRLTDKDTKEGKGKNIPLNHHAKKVLDEIIPHVHHNLVFTYMHKPIPKMCEIFESCCKKAGLPYGRKKSNGITFHDIRRTVKTNMLEAGVDKVYRDIILGHALEGMDVYYVQPSDERLKSAMKKYTEWFDSEVNKLQSIDHSIDQKTGN